MNDHDAIDAINAILDRTFRAELGCLEALNQIAQISGENHNSHKEAKQ